MYIVAMQASHTSSFLASILPVILVPPPPIHCGHLCRLSLPGSRKFPSPVSLEKQQRVRPRGKSLLN